MDYSREPVIPAELVDFDYILTKDKLENGDEFEDFLAKNPSLGQLHGK